MKKKILNILRKNNVQILDSKKVTIGELLITSYGNVYLPGKTLYGYCYKNMSATENEICYIPEKDFNSYTSLLLSKEKVGYSFGDLLKKVDGRTRLVNVMLKNIQVETPDDWCDFVSHCFW